MRWLAAIAAMGCLGAGAVSAQDYSGPVLAEVEVGVLLTDLSDDIAAVSVWCGVSADPPVGGLGLLGEGEALILSGEYGADPTIPPDAITRVQGLARSGFNGEVMVRIHGARELGLLAALWTAGSCKLYLQDRASLLGPDGESYGPRDCRAGPGWNNRDFDCIGPKVSLEDTVFTFENSSAEETPLPGEDD